MQLGSRAFTHGEHKVCLTRGWRILDRRGRREKPPRTLRKPSYHRGRGWRLSRGCRLSWGLAFAGVFCKLAKVRVQISSAHPVAATGTQQTEIPVELDQRRGAAFVGLHPHGDRFRAIIFTLQETSAAVVTNAAPFETAGESRGRPLCNSRRCDGRSGVRQFPPAAIRNSPRHRAEGSLPPSISSMIRPA